MTRWPDGQINWFFMANCVQCGRELPSISVGELRDRCPACQFQMQQQGETAGPRPVSRRLTLAEQAKLCPITAAIVGINLAVYVGCVIGTYLSHQGSAMDFSTDLVLRWGANYGPLSLDGQWWRTFTCMWLHGGLIHVAANMYGLWGFGQITERIFGRGRYLAIYLITGFSASLASLAWHPTNISVGASGAIFGVVGALVWPFYRKRLHLPAPVMSAMLKNIIVVIVINLIIGASIPLIDNAAHLGGLVSGLILGIVFLHFAISGAEQESIVWKVAAASAIILCASFFVIRQERLPDTYADASFRALVAGNQQEALTRARQAISAKPNDPDSHVAMGEVFLQQKKFQDAVNEYTIAHRLAPNEGAITGRLGHTYARMSDWNNAEPLLRAALKADPKDSDAMIDLGVTLAATDRTDEGLAQIRHALQIEPDSARGHFVLGTMLADQGKFTDAVPELKEAVRLDPDNADYKKALQAAQQTGGAGK